MIPLVITATFEIVTPMFLGGADHEATRIRESSIKGALAFWWRALNYGRFVEEAAKPNAEKTQERKEKSALELMQMDEQKLFGGPDGRGVFLLRVKKQPMNRLEKRNRLGVDGNHCNASPPKKNRRDDPAGWNNWEKKIAGPGARYMGYGLMGAAAKKAALLDRSCIKAGQTFSLEIIFKPAHKELMKEEILPAIKLFGLLGGLGSRVRRGWGSIALKTLSAENIDDCEGWSAPKSKDEYKRVIKELLEGKCNNSGTDWPLTAFAKESRVWISDKYCNQNEAEAIWKSGLAALDKMGRALLNYRAWGQYGKVGDQKVQQQFREDHNWFYNKSPVVDIPHRAAFGLPQNYFKFVKNGPNLKGSVNQGKEGRRGSPMFFHVSKVGSQYIGVVSLFPTLFISGNIQAKNSVRQTHDDAYSLNDCYGISKKTTGKKVLEDFVGHGPKYRTPNQVITFNKILP